MEAMRSTWTDERLDDGFDRVNGRFDDVNQRLDRIESRLDSFQSMSERRFDTIQQTVVYAIAGTSAATITALMSAIAIFS